MSVQPARPPSRLARLKDSDLYFAFCSDKVVIASAVLTLVFIVAAMLSPWLAPHDPYDLQSLSILDASTPPRWAEGGDPRFLLGTDNMGRDLFSTILHGLRLSIIIGVASVVLALFIGVMAGLLAGYYGGRIDSFIMRLADVQLTFPAILTALLIDGVARVMLGAHKGEGGEMGILIVAIGLSYWVQYARTVRSSTMVERNKDYVQAARLIGRPSFAIMLRHVLPNVLGPVMVIGTINLAVAIISEATLSFLGVGLPPTQPSLGTLISIGNNFLFSGEWWIITFPAITLALLVLAVNLLGDWLRDALNPRLK